MDKGVDRPHLCLCDLDSPEGQLVSNETAFNRVYSDWTRHHQFEGVKHNALVSQSEHSHRPRQGAATATCVGIRSSQSEVVAMFLMATMITK